MCWPGRDTYAGAVVDDGLLEIGAHCFDLARTGRTADLLAYLDAGVPVDLTDAHGNTLLMLAAYHEHADTVGALLVRGAAPGALNDRGQTSVAGAVFKGAADVVAALVAAGADPDAGTPSARASAMFFGRTEMLGLLGPAPDASTAD